jgi:Beta-propeller repeat
MSTRLFRSGEIAATVVLVFDDAPRCRASRTSDADPERLGSVGPDWKVSPPSGTDHADGVPPVAKQVRQMYRRRNTETVAFTNGPTAPHGRGNHTESRDSNANLHTSPRAVVEARYYHIRQGCQSGTDAPTPSCELSPQRRPVQVRCLPTRDGWPYRCPLSLSYASPVSYLSGTGSPIENRVAADPRHPFARVVLGCLALIATSLALLPCPVKSARVAAPAPFRLEDVAANPARKLQGSDPLATGPFLKYSTYLGGSSADEIRSIAVDAEGCVYVTGNTISTDFYVLNPAQPSYSGPNSIEDVFVAKLNPEGTALIYSTYLGGHGRDLGLAIAVDSSGCAYVTGLTTSADFPTTPAAFQTMARGGNNCFVAKLSANGSTLLYSTYLGGIGNQRGNAITVDSSGCAYVTGSTTSADFPITAPAFQRGLRGFEDAFVTKLDPSGASLAYSTFLGGDGNTDEGLGIAVDASANAYIVGNTVSADFPVTTGAFQPQFHGGDGSFGDAFVAKLDQAGTRLVYSTYLGGSDFEVGAAVAVTSDGEACVAGTTRSPDFPTANAIQPSNASPCADSFSNCTDAFVAKLDQFGGHLVFSTYLGGGSRASSPFQAGDSAAGIALDQQGNAFVAGTTSSIDFPAYKAIQPAKGGNGDSFVVKISPTGEMLYSTYLGGPGDESGSAVAALADGSAYVAGVATSSGFPTSPGALQAVFRGSFQTAALARDGFVSRVSSILPLITGAAIAGKNLLVFGEHFDERPVILLDGNPQKTKRKAADPPTSLRGKKSGKRIGRGQTVIIRVRNADGGLSPPFPFTRPE